MTQAFTLPTHGWPVLQPGWVWLVGAGPGDPGLLTLHALNALRQADVIVHDALVPQDILNWAPQARLEYAGKRAGQPSTRQEDICDRLIALARQGLRVLRLKGGDPFVFGRGGEEAQALIAAGVPVRIVPGITAGIGGLAAAGIPATHRDFNQSVSFITGHDHSGEIPASLNWRAIAEGSQMLVIYMGLRHARQIADRLIAAGRPADEPCAIVANASLPDQRVVETTLADLAGDVAQCGISAPALLVVGENVRLRAQLDWARQAAGLRIAAE
jgi:uroporphyrin-III C-methyltransferase